MDVVSLCALPASGFEWQPSAGTHVLTVVCKATFELHPNTCVLASEQEEPLSVDAHWNDDPNRSLVVPSDRAPYKPRADVVLVGHAHAPGQQPARRVMTRLVVGEIDKSIEVWCNRSVRRLPGGQVLEGQRLTQMPLTWERAAGGPETDNPVGVRFDAEPDQYGMIMIPNLQPPGVHVHQWGDTFAAIGYGAIAPRWPSRARRLHRHALTFKSQGWEGQPLPEHFDYGYFNVAPHDQQVEELRPNERIVLENLHPGHERLVTALPGIRPRAIADRATGEREEIALVADTLWIDTTQGICTVVWRGRLGLRHSHEAGRVAIWLDELRGESSASAASMHSPATVDHVVDDVVDDVEEIEAIPDSAPVTPRSSTSAETWAGLPFARSTPTPPPLADINPGAPPPWVGPLAKANVSEGAESATGPVAPRPNQTLPFAPNPEAATAEGAPGPISVSRRSTLPFVRTPEVPAAAVAPGPVDPPGKAPLPFARTPGAAMTEVAPGPTAARRKHTLPFVHTPEVPAAAVAPGPVAPPGKAPLPFVRGAGASPGLMAAPQATEDAIVNEATTPGDADSRPMLQPSGGVLPFQTPAGPALASGEPEPAQSTRSSRPVDVFAALPFRPPAPLPEPSPVSAPVPSAIPSAVPSAVPFPQSAPLSEAAAPSPVSSPRKAASSARKGVDQATIDRHADVKAALWTKGDPRAAVEDVLRELGIDEDEYREGEERLHDALAEEARAGGSTLARAVRVAVKRAQLVATTAGAKGAGERASSGL